MVRCSSKPLKESRAAASPISIQRIQPHPLIFIILIVKYKNYRISVKSWPTSSPEEIHLSTFDCSLLSSLVHSEFTALGRQLSRVDGEATLGDDCAETKTYHQTMERYLSSVKNFYECSCSSA